MDLWQLVLYGFFFTAVIAIAGVVRVVRDRRRILAGTHLRIGRRVYPVRQFNPLNDGRSDLNAADLYDPGEVAYDIILGDTVGIEGGAV